jgi:peroxiredoxin
MTRKWNAVAIALAVLLAASISMAQPGSDPVPVDPGNQRAVMPQQQRIEWLGEQIEQWKQHQETLIQQLREIHAQAVKEKATDTADRVEKLIGTQQEAFRVRLGQLEQQQQRLMRTLRQRGDRPERTGRRGRRAPDVELKSFDGRTYKLSDLEGRIVVLEWFNPSCPFSQYHYNTKSTMVDLANKYKDKEVVWLAVNSTSNTDPQANLAFAKEHKLPYPIIDDRSGRIGRAFGARTTPHVFVIDKDGIVAYQGAIDNAPMGKVEANVANINYVDQAISQLLAGQQVTTPVTPSYGCSVKYGSNR